MSKATTVEAPAAAGFILQDGILYWQDTAGVLTGGKAIKRDLFSVRMRASTDPDVLKHVADETNGYPKNLRGIAEAKLEKLVTAGGGLVITVPAAAPVVVEDATDGDQMRAALSAVFADPGAKIIKLVDSEPVKSDDGLIFDGLKDKTYLAKVRPNVGYTEFEAYADQHSVFAIHLIVTPDDLKDSKHWSSAFAINAKGEVDRVSQDASKFTGHKLPPGYRIAIRRVDNSAPAGSVPAPDADDDEFEIELEEGEQGISAGSLNRWRTFSPRQKFIIKQIIPRNGQSAILTLEAGNFDYHHAGELWGPSWYEVYFIAPPKQTTVEDFSGSGEDMDDDPQTDIEDFTAAAQDLVDAIADAAADKTVSPYSITCDVDSMLDLPDGSTVNIEGETWTRVGLSMQPNKAGSTGYLVDAFAEAYSGKSMSVTPPKPSAGSNSNGKAKGGK